MKKIFVILILFCSLNSFGQGIITKVENDTAKNEMVLTGAFANPVRIKKGSFSHIQSDTATLSIYLKNSTKYTMKYWQVTSPVTTSNDSLSKIIAGYTKDYAGSVSATVVGGATSAKQDSIIKYQKQQIDSLGKIIVNGENATSELLHLTDNTQIGRLSFADGAEAGRNGSGDGLTITPQTGADIGIKGWDGSGYVPILTDANGIIKTTSSDTTIFPAGEITIASSSVTDDASVTAGAFSISFTTSSDFSGNINGVARAISTTYTFTAPLGKTLPAIVYTTITGSIIIDKMTE